MDGDNDSPYENETEEAAIYDSEMADTSVFEFASEFEVPSTFSSIDDTLDYISDLFRKLKRTAEGDVLYRFVEEETRKVLNEVGIHVREGRDISEELDNWKREVLRSQSEITELNLNEDSLLFYAMLVRNTPPSEVDPPFKFAVMEDLYSKTHKMVQTLLYRQKECTTALLQARQEIEERMQQLHSLGERSQQDTNAALAEIRQKAEEIQEMQMHYEQLRAKTAEKEETIRGLEIAVVQLQGKFETAQEDSLFLVHEIDSRKLLSDWALREAERSAAAAREAAAEALRNAEETAETLRERLAAVESDARSELSAREQTVSQLRERVLALEGNDELKQNYSRELETELTEKRNLLNETKRELAARTAELESERQRHSEQLSAAEKNLSAANAKLEDRRIELEATAKSLQNARGELKTHRDNAQKLREDALERVAQENKKARDALAKFESLERESAATAEALRKELDEKNKALDVERRNLRELSAVTENLRVSHEQQVQSLEAEIERVKEALQIKQKRIDQKNKAYTDLQNLYHQSQEAENRVIANADELKKSIAARLNNILQLWQLNTENPEDYEKTLAVIERDLIVRFQDLQSENVAYKEVDSRIASILDEVFIGKQTNPPGRVQNLQQLVVRYREAQRSLEEATATRDELQSLRDYVGKSITDILVSLHALNGVREHFTSEQVRELFDKLRTATGSLVSEISRRDENIACQNSFISGLEEKTALLEGRISQLSGRLSEAEASSSFYRTENESRNEQLEVRKRELLRIASELEEAKKQSALHAEISDGHITTIADLTASREANERDLEGLRLKLLGTEAQASAEAEKSKHLGRLLDEATKQVDAIFETFRFDRPNNVQGDIELSVLIKRVGDFLKDLNAENVKKTNDNSKLRAELATSAVKVREVNQTVNAYEESVAELEKKNKALHAVVDKLKEKNIVLKNRQKTDELMADAEKYRGERDACRNSVRKMGELAVRAAKIINAVNPAATERALSDFLSDVVPQFTDVRETEHLVAIVRNTREVLQAQQLRVTEVMFQLEEYTQNQTKCGEMEKKLQAMEGAARMLGEFVQSELSRTVADVREAITRIPEGQGWSDSVRSDLISILERLTAAQNSASEGVFQTAFHLAFDVMSSTLARSQTLYATVVDTEGKLRALQSEDARRAESLAFAENQLRQLREETAGLSQSLVRLAKSPSFPDIVSSLQETFRGVENLDIEAVLKLPPQLVPLLEGMSECASVQIDVSTPDALIESLKVTVDEIRRRTAAYKKCSCGSEGELMQKYRECTTRLDIVSKKLQDATSTNFNYAEIRSDQWKLIQIVTGADPKVVNDFATLLRRLSKTGGDKNITALLAAINNIISNWAKEGWGGEDKKKAKKPKTHTSRIPISPYTVRGPASYTTTAATTTTTTPAPVTSHLPGPTTRPPPPPNVLAQIYPTVASPPVPPAADVSTPTLEERSVLPMDTTEFTVKEKEEFQNLIQKLERMEPFTDSESIQFRSFLDKRSAMTSSEKFELSFDRKNSRSRDRSRSPLRKEKGAQSSRTKLQFELKPSYSTMGYIQSFEISANNQRLKNDLEELKQSLPPDQTEITDNLKLLTKDEANEILKNRTRRELKRLYAAKIQQLDEGTAENKTTATEQQQQAQENEELLIVL